MSIQINPDDLTLDELEELDELLPGGVSAITSGAIPVRAMRVIAYIVTKRDNPAFTLEDAGKFKLADFDLGDAPGEGDAAAT